MTIISGAIERMQTDPTIGVFRALMASREDPSDAAPLVEAMAAILTVAGITPAALGPDMIEQLVAWEKATSRDDVIATMQRAAA